MENLDRYRVVISGTGLGLLGKLLKNRQSWSQFLIF